MSDNISIRAGSKAIKIIKDEGLDLDRVKVLAGASGAAKFLVLTGIDRVLTDMLKSRTAPLYMIGTSIGAFRMAAFCQKDPAASIKILEREYIGQAFPKKPTKQDLSIVSKGILDAFIKDDEIKDMLTHPFMRISFLANRCRGLLKKDRLMLEWTGMLMAAGANLVSRNLLKYFFERALFCPPGITPPFSAMNQFPLHRYDLTPGNFKQALLSSGTIPLVMEGISDIDGVQGHFKDGGMLDYHLDIPFLPDDDGLVLYPHFYDTITPGWFDKSLNRKPSPENMKNVVLVAPSKSFVESLPMGKIPDRKDFYTFKRRDRERQTVWWDVVRRNRQVGETFFEAVDSGRIRNMVTPLQ